MKGKRFRKTVTIIVVLLAMIAAAALFFSWHMVRGGSFRQDSDVRHDREAYQTETETDTEKLTPEMLYHLEEVKPVSGDQLKGMYTLLVIGGASPEQEKKGKNRKDADAILMLTFNTPMKTLYLTSFNNDLYVQIPDYGPGRLSNAYAIGGGPLLARTIEENYGTPVDNYGIISLADAARVLELPEMENIDLSHKGIEVLEKLIYELNITDPAKVVAKLTSLLSLVTHNISPDQMMQLLLRAPGYVSYYSEDHLLPYDGLYRELDGYVVPDITATAIKLQATIYQRPEEET